MRIAPRTLAPCLALFATAWALAFPQVGADRRPTPPPPKKTTPARKSTPPRRNTGSAATARPGAPKAAPRAGAVVRNQMGMELVYVPAGSFTMGSPSSEAGRDSDEEPQHQVTISAGFYMGRYEVTQAQWRAVMGNNPSNFKGANLPVDSVSWDDAQEFVRRLNRRGDGYTYRLPTEAEWEYAARGGTVTAHFWGEDVKPACRYANLADQTGKAKHADWTILDCRDGYAESSPAGNFMPNNFGLYDMIGNVWEWCEDWYHDSYNGAPTDASAWVAGLFVTPLPSRVIRGGSWSSILKQLRPADRNGNRPGFRGDNIGFRVVAVART